MKVKLFCDSNMQALENLVNEFIAEHDIADIKFSSSTKFFDIMILYNDKDE